jgi:hypothetical protein
VSFSRPNLKGWRGNNIMAIDVEGQGSPTIQEIRDCMEAGYRGIDSNENTTTENADDSNEDENDMIKRYQL